MNNKIRKGSLAWYASKYGKTIIIAVLILVVIVIITTTRSTETNALSEENVKVEQDFIKKGKSLKNEFSTFDVPLEEDLQLYIHELSDRYSVPMELILAVIGQESNYDSAKIGDNGNSYGLMQVQPTWHEERMTHYNVTDLLNPYENCLIGVDYLAECIDRFGTTYGLIAYNAGPDDAIALAKQGIITEYAESVIYLSENL